MLKKISIQNLAIIASVSIEFGPHFTVLTGETGAGKSILMDAIQLAFGQRADAQWVRPGNSSCHIRLDFDVTDQPNAQRWLSEQNFPITHHCQLERVLYPNGRSLSLLNGQPCPAKLLRQLRPLLIHIHSQQSQWALYSPETQLQVLDQIADHHEALKELQQAAFLLKETRMQLATLQQQQKDRDQRLDYLSYQYQELEQLALQEQEWELLHQEHAKLHQAQNLVTHLQQVLHTIENSRPIPLKTMLQQTIDTLKNLQFKNPTLSEITELLESAAIHVEEASSSLQDYTERLEFNSDRLAQIEKRLSKLQDTARKHHVSPKELPDLLRSFKNQMDQLLQLDNIIQTCVSNMAQHKALYDQWAQQISQTRAIAAQCLTDYVNEWLPQVGMQMATFKASLFPATQEEHPDGNETVQFIMQTNPGLPQGPIAQVLSGGELSRLALILQIATAERHNIPTLIFDEADTGIGGETAHAIGKLLRGLGEKNQLIVISHLPQVAAFAHHHMAVSKHVEQDETILDLRPLSANERPTEIARMLGGNQALDISLSLAAEMLEHAH